MKIAWCLLLVLVLAFGVAGCGVASEGGSETSEKAKVAVETEKKKTTKDNHTLYDGVYYVGDDMEAGKYIFDVSSEYTGRVVCFESKETYETYKANNGYTVGENNAAIEKFALYDFYVYTDQCYLGLEDGNVLLLEDCSGSIRKLNDGWYKEDAAALVTGVYFQGSDIDAGRYVMSYAKADYSIGVTVFESLDKYTQYHRSAKSNGAEESEAIDQYAMDSQWLFDGETCSVSIKEGGVLIVSDGAVSASIS